MTRTGHASACYPITVLARNRAPFGRRPRHPVSGTLGIGSHLGGHGRPHGERAGRHLGWNGAHDQTREDRR